jgi:hypothetical protein
VIDPVVVLIEAGVEADYVTVVDVMPRFDDVEACSVTMTLTKPPDVAAAVTGGTKIEQARAEADTEMPIDSSLLTMSKSFWRLPNGIGSAPSMLDTARFKAPCYMRFVPFWRHVGVFLQVRLRWLQYPIGPER